MLIAIAGPYFGNASTASERQHNLDVMNRAALSVFKKGHTPIVGVNNALPLFKDLGENELHHAIMQVSIPAVGVCDALLLLGESTGACMERDFMLANGKEVFRSIDEIPDWSVEEQVVLVNTDGKELGLMPKTEAHLKGYLHKAISVIVFNSKGEMLIQQRAYTKYHWAGIWSNTVCSHPRHNETYSEAAHRRVREELGFETPLKELFHFIYKAKDDSSGLTEHEYDTVFTGTYEGECQLNKDEVEAVEWIKPDALMKDIAVHPDKYSFWFKIILREMQQRGDL
jgi:isopentenyl-diphosphate delta-isomerase